MAPDSSQIFCCLDTPGSWNDDAVARHQYDKLLRRTPGGYHAIADTVFSPNDSHMHGRIKTPMKKSSSVLRLLERRGSARQAAECGMRTLQGAFTRVKMPLPADDHKYRLDILTASMHLHQLRTRRVGINQIRAVYENIFAWG
ncbi:hypothetical protein JG688_00012261 [Phytophthora aleatoria]|uniref:DDE Tnp4 domain-containing protein n=1 Tax=Phytophthora aleatoria TaxID=2496075 RepID=A0A8J5IJB8_9STRA|nr:hypothetical protein JG688_00012261 [Phytophthora aleatoria]